MEKSKENMDTDVRGQGLTMICYTNGSNSSQGMQGKDNQGLNPTTYINSVEWLTHLKNQQRWWLLEAAIERMFQACIFIVQEYKLRSPSEKTIILNIINYYY